jgi:hypothetical protein
MSVIGALRGAVSIDAGRLSAAPGSASATLGWPRRAAEGPRLDRRAGPSDADSCPVDAWLVEPVSVSEVSAHATPVPVAMAAPIPNATAKAPSRPMCAPAPPQER